MKVNNIDKAMQSAARSTVNKLINRGRVRASKRVREKYNIKATALRASTKTHRATNRNPAATLIVRGRMMPVILFSAKQNRRGVSVRIIKESGRKTIKSAFIATMPSGKSQVWMRSGGPRLPIKQIVTLSPAKMFEKEGEKAIKSLILNEMGKTFKHELNHFISRLK